MWFNWVKENMKEGSKVGLDFTQYAEARLATRIEEFEKKGITLVSTENLVDQVWAKQGKPEKKLNPAFHLEEKWTGKSSEKKYEEVTKKLDGSVDTLLITTLDDIAWLLNMRGTDIEYNPIFFSYVLFSPGEQATVDLFISSSQIADVADYLKSIRVTVHAYEDIEEHLKKLAGEKKKIGIDKNDCNARLYRAVKGAGGEIVDKESVVKIIKASKNPVEQEGMRNCNIRDCAAIMKYFSILEQELAKEDHGLDEFNGARKIDELRTLGENHQGPSFETISSIGANGAIIHYAPKVDKATKLNNDEIYLLDSGGQYLDGTTDITRTAFFGAKYGK